MDQRIRKKISFWITFILVAIGFTVVIIMAKKDERRRYLEEAERVKEINAELEKDTVRSEEEILERLENAIIADETDNIYMRVPGTFSQDDIQAIGRKIDPFLGRYTQLTYTTTSSQDGDEGPVIVDHFVGINYNFEKYDEYRVYEAIVDGREISADHPKALELKAVCEKFLKENISDSMSEYDKELAIHDFIINNCAYSDSDANDMTEYQAYGALVNHKAVCEGYARATALLMKCCNIETTLISGHADNGSAADPSNPDGGGSEGTIVTPDGRVMGGHMWNRVKIDGQWYNLDTTWDDPLSDEDRVRHTYFNVDDNILSKNHSWQNNDSIECTSMDANFYKKSGTYFESDASYKEYLRNELASGNRDIPECAITNVDTSKEAMSFVFEYEGIMSYHITTNGVDGYEIVWISFATE